MSRRRAGERRREEIKLGLDVHARQVTICRQVDGDMPQPPVSSYFIRQASDTRKPCRNIRSNKQRSRTSFLLPLVASINRSTSRLVRCFRSLSPRQCSPLCVRLSFCREFGLLHALETRRHLSIIDLT